MSDDYETPIRNPAQEEYDRRMNISKTDSEAPHAEHLNPNVQSSTESAQDSLRKAFNYPE